jgi:ABC-type multidrug transport system ATPase subunit
MASIWLSKYTLAENILGVSLFQMQVWIISTDVIVCPQFDALDRMTTREHLFFYARAKGIAMVERDVTLVMERTGLKSYEHRLAAKLSGGNRRKLSLAIALLGKQDTF